MFKKYDISWARLKLLVIRDTPAVMAYVERQRYISGAEGDDAVGYDVYAHNGLGLFQARIVSADDKADFLLPEHVNSYTGVDSEDEVVSLITPSRNARGAQQVEIVNRIGAPDYLQWTVVSPDWCDKTTWWQGAEKITDQLLTKELLANEWKSAAHTHWINPHHPRITAQEYNSGVADPANPGSLLHVGMWQPNGTLLPKREYVPIITRNGTPLAAGEYQIDYVTGTVYPNPGVLSGGDVVRATFYRAVSSQFVLSPREGRRWELSHVEIQKTAGSGFVLNDTSVFETWRDPAGAFTDTNRRTSRMPYVSIGHLHSTAVAAYASYLAGGGTSPMTPDAFVGYGKNYTRGVASGIEILVWKFRQAFELKSSRHDALRLFLANNVPHTGEICTYTLYLDEFNDE